MAQRIQQFDPSMAAPTSQSYLNHDSAQKGYPQMNSHVPPMANMDDGSLFTNLEHGGFQAQRNYTQGVQHAQQNQNSLRPQAAAAAMGVQRKEMTRQATEEKRVNDWASNRVKDVIYYTSGGGALKQLATQGPEYYRNMQVSAAMFGGPQPGTLNQVNQEIS